MKNIDIIKNHDNHYKPLSKLDNSMPLVSIILPSFNVASSLPLVLDALNKQTYKNLEVLVIDDGSIEDISNFDNNLSISLKYIRHKGRQDRSAARNTGLYYAKGEYSLILDPDIVLNAISVEKLVESANKYGDNIFIGFRENINKESLLDRLFKNQDADYTKDIRYFYNYTPKVPILSIFGKEEESRVIKILEETAMLTDFPYTKVIGSWDLASIITGHTMFMKTATAINIGGYDESYTGWGFDDIAFGAKMIVEGRYVIPVIEATGFHIDHAPHSANETKKWIEFSNNRNRYFDWLNQEYALEPFNRDRKVERICHVISK